MVGQWPLKPLIGVRIPVGQLAKFIMSDIEKIIRDFGELQEEVGNRIMTHYPTLKFPQSLLPHSKEEISSAFDKAIQLKYADQKVVEVLRAGKQFLLNFVDDKEAYDSNHQLLGQSGYWEALRRQSSKFPVKE